MFGNRILAKNLKALYHTIASKYSYVQTTKNATFIQIEIEYDLAFTVSNVNTFFLLILTFKYTDTYRYKLYRLHEKI